MQPYLVYGLTSTLGAMGELAGHERRGALGSTGACLVQCCVWLADGSQQLSCVLSGNAGGAGFSHVRL